MVFGEISVYEVRGQYQLIVRTLVEDGVGRLQREFEALKKRLAEEGLFAPERKRPIPLLPSTVGFILADGRAAVRDFLAHSHPPALAGAGRRAAGQGPGCGRGGGHGRDAPDSPPAWASSTSW